MSFVSQIIGDPNQRYLNKIRPLVEKVNELEKEFEQFSDAQLREKTNEFRARLGVNLPSTSSSNKIQNETLDDLLPESFACVREAAKRTLGLRHFDMQIIGGVVLHQGKIAEMKTGEGKTLAATLAVYLNALEGKGVQVITVNDYLAKRDANWMGPIYHLLGMSVGSIQHDKAFIFDPPARNALRSDADGHDAPDKNEITVEMQNLKQVPRKSAYDADITYGTNNEFGFDYLRDNMVADFLQMAQARGTTRNNARNHAENFHHYAIVDEVDSILIDEARTPLIISAPDTESTKLYETFTKLIPKLKENIDYNIDEKMKAATLTEEGIERVEKLLGMEIYTEGGIRYVHQLEQALRAHTLFKLDKDYVVSAKGGSLPDSASHWQAGASGGKDGEVIIVDEFTGRLMFGRRYSGGLHQAIEAKEGVRVQQESRTLATITFQNYFRMYKKLAGMTGTALTNAEEFSKVYKLEVVVIPTNKTMVRQDMPDQVFRTDRGKFQAVIKEIKERNQKGQPVLVGTVSIEKNELLSAFLKKEGIPHNILNAKNHEKEAQIIAEAGRVGAVTIATNMAGRGVDIILGGKAITGEDWQKAHDKVVELGGLHIIGTERHEARRIDNQLRGRAGRQGDPGSSQFMVSLEDDLMRIFGSDKIKRMMEIFNLPEDQPIENKMVSRALESAQGKIEGFNFDIRNHVLEYDDVMNKQRETIYRKRKEVLIGVIASDSEAILLDDHEIAKPVLSEAKDLFPPRNDGLKAQILGMTKNEIKKIVEFHTQESYADNWNLEEISEIANAMIDLSNKEKDEVKNFKDKDELIECLEKLAEEKYLEKESQVGAENMRQVEKAVMLRVIDMLWMEHLDNMEYLRDSVRLRAYGQRDPLVEYKNEGHRLFIQLLENIQTNVAGMIFKVDIAPAQAQQPRPNPLLNKERGQGGIGRPTEPGDGQAKLGRNDPCPCGATHLDGRPKKYKRCHGV